MNINLALAVNSSKTFEERHFGEAEQFLIYQWNEDHFIFQETILNPLTQSSNHQHSLEKAKEVVNLLKSKNISILVSRRFGQNIRRVNDSFIPVLIGVSTTEELFPILKKQMRWIVEEWQTNAGNYKLFNLKKGTIKEIIR